MYKKTFLLAFTSLFILSACGGNSNQNTEPEDTGPKNELVITSNANSFRTGDYLENSQFSVKDEAGNEVSEYEITNYDLFKQGEQEITFTTKDNKKYGTFKLTLSPRNENLKVLFVANSHADDTLTYAYRQVKSMSGISDDIHFVNNYKGGHDLQGYGNEGIGGLELYTFNDFNLSNPYSDPELRALSYAVEADNWDFIVLQQYTQEYHLTAQFNNIDRICEHCLQHCSNKNVKFLFNMTFAYPDGTSLPLFQSKFDGSCDKLYDRIIDVMKNIVLPNKHIDAVIPMGTAIKNAMTSSLSVDDLFRDDGVEMRYEHLSLNYGRYIAGMAFVSFITGRPAEDITFTNNYPEKVINIAKQSVKAMNDKPFEETTINL